jgi:hypothetical protein
MLQNIFENKKVKVRCLEQNGAISIIFIVTFLTEPLTLFTFLSVSEVRNLSRVLRPINNAFHYFILISFSL